MSNFDSLLNQWEQELVSPLHEKLLGADPRIKEINHLVRQLAQTNLTVLVAGETGTGKDIIAKLLHKLSTRYGKPFVKVNCPSIPESIFESELFGYERGAFTGAYNSRPGRFELAHEGTIFLDEISEIPSRVQVKLLQILDGEPFMRIGGTAPLRADARVIAATNVPLDEAVEEGRLRKDVSFRLSEVVIHLPPLRTRRGDIPLLAEHFNYNACRLMKKEYHRLSSDTFRRLQDQDWPGNVRELAGRVKEYVATGQLDALFTPPASVNLSGDAESAGPGAAPSNGPRQFLTLKEAARQAAEAAERNLIEETLRYTLWNRRKAAKLLNTSYSSLLRRIETYKIGKA